MHRDQYEFEYGRKVRLHLDVLLVFVQIILSSMLSPGHILIHFFAFSGSDLRSQSGYTFLGQSRGEISLVSREIEYGSASCHSGSVYGHRGFYPGGFS